MPMNLLHANDRPGAYPPSWYAATANENAPYPALESDVVADVCLVGAGYTGLSAALHLAEAGLRVVVLEAHRAGFGASGRNGGQLGSGQRKDQTELEPMVGREDARKLWDMGEDAKSLVKDLIVRHRIDCDLKPGVAWAGSRDSDVRGIHGYADHLRDVYGYHEIEVLERDAFHALCPSPDYCGGMLDMGAGHLHPLNYALGLAQAAAGAGAQIFELSEVLAIEEGRPATLRTASGTVKADHVILACNGYLGRLEKRVAARVMPINNFIVATEPLGDDAAQVLTRDVAIADSRFVINYFRLSADKRLLFGGGETYGYRFPKDIAALVRKPMLEIYPHLRDVRIDYAWGGTLAITVKRMPYLARLGSNILTASGYSGHGVGSATHAGQLCARAIQGETSGFDVFARLPSPAFPGGAAARNPLLLLAMTWFGLRDRLGI